MKHVIIGTAGHIDHGKTALIKALTGQDADRLPEEKQRGITIDLGYAWCDLGSVRAGFVDVPGHEKLIANMVSGVTGMDMVLFTVAADEGMMPQSYEHLDIMDSLGIRRGIVVITIADLAGPDDIRYLTEQIKKEIAGTFLEQSPVIPTSIKTSEGIDKLRRTMQEMAEEIEASRQTDKNHRAEGSDEDIPRLPVDRSFTLPGFGTIVTGTLLSGVIKKGDELTIYPGGLPCRVRTLQSYGKDVNEAGAGQRCALNLPRISTEEAARGSVIAPEGALKPSRIMDVQIKVTPRFTRTLKNGMRAHFLIGTSRVLCRLYFKEQSHEEDALLPAHVRLEEPVCALKGDRFILRFYSPLETIGGGIILNPDARRVRKRKTPVEKTRDEIPVKNQKTAAYLMKEFKEAGFRFVSINSLDLSGDDEKKVEQTLKMLERSGQVVRLDTYHYTTAAVAGRAQEIVLEYFDAHEELATGTLRDLLGTNRTSARVLLEYLDRKKVTKQQGGAAVHVKA